MTSAGMTSSTGTRQPDHDELRSTSIPCNALYRDGTLSTRPDDWRGEDVDDRMMEQMDTERSRHDTGQWSPRVLQDDVMSLDNEDVSVSFSNVSKDATCSGSYMHLRSKTSRDSQTDNVELDDPAVMRRRQRRRRTRDVCRPLRHWLYGHRDTPYPSRADKLQLAADTQLSLTQISNWFANARRRLKNTVDRAVAQRCRPLTSDLDGMIGLDWAQRIRLYNRHTVGNQERLSISSEDSDNDDDGAKITADPHVNAVKCGGEGTVTACDGSLSEARALDRLDFIMSPLDGSTVTDELERLRHRNASGSLSSHDYEEMSTSSASLCSTPTYDHCRHLTHLVQSPRLALDFEDYADYPCCNSSDRGAGLYDGAMHWKEISAALALTTLANARPQTRRQT